jgi:hypothetical protein
VVKFVITVALLTLSASVGLADSVYPTQGTSKLNPRARYNLCVADHQRQSHPVGREAWERIYSICGQEVYGVKQ